jgi:hypothetical protein
MVYRDGSGERASPRLLLGGTRWVGNALISVKGSAGFPYSKGHSMGEISMEFSTSLTPGADQAVSSAACFSA